MSTKLYPPTINSILPAFCFDPKFESVAIKIPFTMNKTVSPAEIDGFVLLVKTVSTGTIVDSPRLDKESGTIDGWDYENNILTFRMDKTKVGIGQYYKAQVAYIQDGTVGYYSNVGTIKCTAKPQATIENLSTDKVNTSETKFIGCYKNDGDHSERVYSYRFDVYTQDGALFDTSGDQLHNSSEDIQGESRDTFSLNKDLHLNETYAIYYSVTTVNQLTVSSEKYSILQQETIDPDIKATVIATMNEDNGYIAVSLKGEIIDGIEPAAIGSFYLKRASSKDNYQSWELIYSFKLNGVLPSQWSWKDMTIEQGHSYKYAIQQYSDYLISNRLESNEVLARFDDMYLFDGEKQLKIRYNPKVSSFKITRLETKQDTIGGQYPVFFRNGRVGYKEFPISGLLSYQSDNEELFISKKDIYLTEEPSSHLTDNNIIAEREFKLQVLNWLGDGKPKLFRSPGEGNYIVRLLNTSLSPNDTLGRMLHTFSSTAYEICDFTYENAVKFNFLNVGNLNMEKVVRWSSIDLTKFSAENNVVYNTGVPMTSLTIANAVPGSQFELYLNDGVYIPDTTGKTDWAEGSDIPINIAIGPTGMYKLELTDNIHINKVVYKSGGQARGQLTYSYESTFQNVFDLVKDVKINNWKFMQYIGAHEDIIGNMEERIVYIVGEGANTIKKSFQGLKTRLLNIKYLTFYKREQYNIFTNLSQSENTELMYYWDEACTNVARLEPIHIYQVTEVGDPDERDSWYKYYYDPSNKNTPYPIHCNNTIILNGNSEIDISDTYSFSVPDGCELQSIQIGEGVICECAYQTKEVIYDLETTELKTEYAAMEKAWQDYEDCFDKETGIMDKNNPDQIAHTHVLDLQEKWNAYIAARQSLLTSLYVKLQEKKEATGQYD